MQLFHGIVLALPYWNLFSTCLYTHVYINNNNEHQDKYSFYVTVESLSLGVLSFVTARIVITIRYSQLSPSLSWPYAADGKVYSIVGLTIALDVGSVRGLRLSPCLTFIPLFIIITS